MWVKSQQVRHCYWRGAGVFIWDTVYYCFMVVVVGVCGRVKRLRVCVHGNEWVEYQESKVQINTWLNTLIWHVKYYSHTLHRIPTLKYQKHNFDCSIRKLTLQWLILRKAFIIIATICFFPSLLHHTSSGSGVSLGLMTTDDAPTQFPTPSICCG